MRIKRILWVVAAFAFSSFIYAQRTSVPAQSQPQRPESQMEENETSGQPNQGQTAKRAQHPSKGPVPLTEKEVTKEIKNSPAETVIKDVQQRGVDFDMTPDIEKKLRKVKATDEMVEAVRRAGPKVREQTAKMTMGASPAAGPVGVPKEQGQAFDVIKSELDPDKTITLVTDFATKYPQSPLLSYVYSYGANAYQQKGDVEKVVELTQEGLKLKSDNLMCLILSLGMLPQPQYLNNHAAEREKILQEAESEANRALQLIAQLPKQPNEADADHQKRLGQISSPVHASLGMVHLDLATEALAGPDKDELAKSEQEFNTAVAIDRPDPRDYYRMGEAYALDGKVDDAIGAFTKASQYGQGTMIKAYADQRVEELKKKKAQSPAAPKS